MLCIILIFSFIKIWGFLIFDSRVLPFIYPLNKLKIKFYVGIFFALNIPYKEVYFVFSKLYRLWSYRWIDRQTPKHTPRRTNVELYLYNKHSRSYIQLNYKAINSFIK